MKVIIECDDFGLNYGFSDAIFRSLAQKTAKSTCIRINGYAYKYTLSLLRSKLKDIDLGIHIDLTHGPFITKIPLLFKSNYSLTYLEYFLRLLFNDKKLLKAIENEVDAQLKKAKIDKLNISHVNGHDHIHMIPKIFEVFCKYAIKYNINKIRIVNEPFHLTLNVINLAKYLLLKSFSVINIYTADKYKLKYTNAYYGLLDSNHMNQKNIIKCLKNAINKNFNVIEIALHPAYPNFHKDKRLKMSNFTQWFTNLPNRFYEYKSLSNKKLIKFIRDNNIELISYKNI